MSIYDQMMQRYRQGPPGAPQVPMSPAQGMATQQPMQAPQQQGMQMPNSPMMQQGGANAQEMDPALAAILGIESLSPQAESLKRKQATVDALRDMALGGNARHWTGALAQGVAGYGARRNQKRLDPEYEKLGEQRRGLMEKLGGGLFK